MNPSVSEIRQCQMPDAFKKESEWFAKVFAGNFGINNRYISDHDLG